MRKVVAPLVALVMSSCGTLAPAADYQWQAPVVHFTYNHTGAPADVSADTVEAALQDAARKCSAACGVRLEYAGQADEAKNTVRDVRESQWQTLAGRRGHQPL